MCCRDGEPLSTFIIVTACIHEHSRNFYPKCGTRDSPSRSILAYKSFFIVREYRMCCWLRLFLPLLLSLLFQELQALCGHNDTLVRGLGQPRRSLVKIHGSALARPVAQSQ